MKGIQKREKTMKLCKGRGRNSSHDSPVTRDSFMFSVVFFKGVGGECEGRI